MLEMLSPIIGAHSNAPLGVRQLLLLQPILEYCTRLVIVFNCRIFVMSCIFHVLYAEILDAALAYCKLLVSLCF